MFMPWSLKAVIKDTYGGLKWKKIRIALDLLKINYMSIFNLETHSADNDGITQVLTDNQEHKIYRVWKRWSLIVIDKTTYEVCLVIFSKNALKENS